MPLIQEHVSLKRYNTFGIEVQCRYFCEIHSVTEFLELMKEPVYRSNEKLIIGGGSNLLFTKDVNGLVIRNCIKGIEIMKESEEVTEVKAAAGEIWHEFVMWCINNGFCGLENLSLIPGCVGASPMQNIGAYGVEIKELFQELEAYDMSSGERRVFTNTECKFGYRESVFKHEYKNRYLITSVTFRLKNKALVNVSYGAISTELAASGIQQPTIRDVSNTVIKIRQSKLPDPAVLGNAGSFFKNPEVNAETMQRLKKEFPDIVSYPLSNGNSKLAAGWLIEQSGLKGYEMNGAAVHNKQALVIVNKGGCKGKDVYGLSEYVLQTVYRKFGVRLEREVNIL